MPLDDVPTKAGDKAVPDADTFCRQAGLPLDIRANTPLPDYLVAFLLQVSGLDDRSIRLHSSVGQDLCFSDIVNVEVEQADRRQMLHLYLRHGGVADHLPPYMRDWLREEHEVGAQGRSQPLLDFFGILDNAVLKRRFRLRNMHLLEASGEELTSVDRFVATVLGLNLDGSISGDEIWPRDDLVHWGRVVDCLLGAATLEVQITKTLEEFFPFLVEGRNIKVLPAGRGTTPVPAENECRLGGSLGESLPVCLGPHFETTWNTVEVALGPLALTDYWSLLPPRAIPPVEVRRIGLGEPGRLRDRLFQIVRHILPAHLDLAVSVSLAETELTPMLSGTAETSPAILGHSFVLGDDYHLNREEST